MPALRRIFAAIEVGFTTVTEPNKSKDLHLFFLRDELNGSEYSHGMDIIAVWLRGSKFGSDFARIWKLDPKVEWAELSSLLNEKMNGYENEAPIIVLHISKTGLVTRKLNEQLLECPFEKGGMKHKTLLILQGSGCVSTENLRLIMESASEDSVSKTIEKINTAMKTKLQLPKSEKFIENDPGVGYYINPIYNLVVTK